MDIMRGLAIDMTRESQLKDISLQRVVRVIIVEDTLV